MHSYVVRLKSILISLVAISAYAENIQWVAPSPNNDMNTPTNWSPNTVPGSADNAIFDSTVIGVDLTPTENSAPFSVSTFHFPNTASVFDFHFNNQTLAFQGIGITGAFTNPTININNTNNSSFAGNLISFSGPSGTPGNSNITSNNSATLTGSVSNTNLGTITSNFFSNGPFTMTSNGTISVSNTGHDSATGTGNNQVGVANAAQMLLQSTGVVGNNCNITVSNTGINSSNTTSSSDFVGYLNDQQFFVGNAFQAGDAFSLTVTNTGTDSSTGHGGAQVAVINSNSGTTGNQILFLQGGSIGNSGTITATNSGSYSGINTSGGSNVATMNLQQVVIGDSTAPGSYPFSAGDNFHLSVSTSGSDSAHGTGSDAVGPASGDQITLYSPCSLGDNATITLSATGNFSGDATTTFVDVGSTGGDQLNSLSTFQAGDNFTLNVTNGGTSTGSGSGGNYIGALTTGQQVTFNSIVLGTNAYINIANSGSNSSSTTNPNQVGSLMGYGKQLYVQEPFQAGDNLQIVITNSGFDDSTTIGANFVGFINNNAGDETASQLHLNSNATIGNNASISLSNTATYQGNNTGVNRIAALQGQQFYSVTDFQAGDNFNFTATNLGTNNGSGQNSNHIGTVGESNGRCQIQFGTLSDLGNNASFVLSNTGINHDTTGTSNSVGYINGEQFSMLGNFTAGTGLNIEINNSSTNAGDSSNLVGYVNGSQLSFEQNCTLGDGSNIIVSNSGTVTVSQIVFGQGFDISGKAFIQVANTGTVSSHGIDVQGASAGGNANILLSNSSLYVETTLPTFTIGGLVGDATSVAQSHPTLIINTDSSTASEFMGVIENFPAINSTLIKTGGGTQTLAGVNTYTGETTIQGGTLVLTGSLAGDVLIASSGILQGTGTIHNTLTNTGTVAPGQSIGTLTVNNYINNGGTYDVEINGLGQSDLISVSEAATLNGGTVIVSLIDNTFILQEPYTIVTANGGIAGTYTGASSSAFLNPILSYDPNNVYLTIEAALVKAAEACNQYGVAQILDSIIDPNATQSLFISIIATSPLQEAQYALENLSGYQYTNEVWVTDNSTKRLFRRLYDPLRPLATTACDAPCCGRIAWLETGYGYARSDGNNAHSTLVNSYQVTGGIQKTFCCDLTLGLAGSFEYDDINYRNANERRNSGFVCTYALYKSLRCYELINVVYGHDASHVTRLIKVGNFNYKAQSKPHLNTFALYNEMGCDICRACFLLQPFLGFQFATTCRMRIYETQADGWGLTLNAYEWSSSSARLGFHFSNQFLRECITLSLDLACNTLLSSPKNSTQGRFTQFGDTFLICGNTLDNYSVDYALTLFAPFHKKIRGYLKLNGESWQHANTFDITVGFKAFW